MTNSDLTRPALVTFDVYMALLDIQGGLTQHVANTLELSSESATVLVKEWRAQQMLRAASSNSLARGHTSFRDCTRMALTYVCARHGINIEAERVEALSAAWDRLPPWPEADAALAELRNRGVEIAILSNGDQDMLGAIATQFQTPFDYILSAESAGRYKPHPSVYSLPEIRLGLKRDEVIHVAGSSNDVLGAVAYGLKCIWSNRTGDAVLDGQYPPTATVASLSAAVALIGQALTDAG